jgi:hypothetical protein
VGGLTWASRALSRCGRLLAALGLALLVVLVPSASSWAQTPTPAPVPTGVPFEADRWSCTDRFSTLGARVGQDCAVTGWQAEPAYPTEVRVPTIPPVVVPTPTVVATIVPGPQCSADVPCATTVEAVQPDLLALWASAAGLLIVGSLGAFVATVRR